MSGVPSRTGTLFEQIANHLGFQDLKDRVPFLPHPLVCWGITIFVIDFIILQIFKEFAGYQATFFINPTWVIQPLLGLLAPFVVIFLHERYETVLEEIDVTARTANPETFESVTPPALRIGLYIIFISYAIWQFIFNVGVNTITQIGGLAEFIGVALVLPLGYGIIFSEFLATYIGLLVFLPRKIRRTDFKINFLDPEGLGGLRPVGELMKTAYYFVMFGLIGYVIMLYGPSIIGPLTGSPYPDPSLIQGLLFTLVWLLAIGTMLYGLSQIHWFMKREKRAVLTRLDRQARELVSDPFHLENFDISDREEYDIVRQRMEYVNNTREYPTTFTMWVQLLIGLLLPKAVHLILSFL